MSYLILETTDSIITDKECTAYRVDTGDIYTAVKYACGIIQNQYLMNDGADVVEYFLPNELGNANIFNNLLNEKQYVTAFDFYCKNPFLNFRYKIVSGNFSYRVYEPKQLGKDYILKKKVFE